MRSILLIILTLGSLAFAKEDKVTSIQHTTPASTAAQVQPQEIKIGVKGMVCAFCAQGIEKNFLKQPEISKVEVSLENKYVKLFFKDGKTLEKEKIAKILKEAGYESVFEQ